MAIWACALDAAPPSITANETVLAKDFRVMVSPPVYILSTILVSLFPSSMRKRVEFPVCLDLPPTVGKPVGLKHQKADDDQPDGDLAQKGDVVVERKRAVDRGALEGGADPLHRFRQQHHKGRAHQRAHDRASAADDDHREKENRAFDAESFLRNHKLIVRVERTGDAGEECRKPERERP